MEGQAGVLSLAVGAGSRGPPCPGGARTERVRGSWARPELRGRFCARGVLALPLVLPAEGRGGGSLGGPTGPVPAAHPEPGPGRSVLCFWGCRSCWGQAQTPLALVRCRPQPRGCRLSVCAAAAAAAAAWGAGGFQPAPGSCPLSWGEVSGVPSPSLPPLPSWVCGTGETLPKALARGRAELPVPGRQQVCRGSSSGALWSRLWCQELIVPHVSLHRDRRRSPRKKPACLRSSSSVVWAPFVFISLLVQAPVCLQVQLRDGSTLFLPWFQIQLVCSSRPSSWMALACVPAPVHLRLQLICFCPGSWTAPAGSGFQHVIDSSWFELQLALVKTILAFGKVVNQSLS
ncbi:uncharacterized protein LOC121233535 [Aquila chrysaetos chrysaetos]|uniref:uncharacterized protein LOC121233535 n=1 Tax=Aquila chrysaetos chrysaetos TaxID=223781 RepID=UPI001B7D392E|nr:uncharacterized protein LOC121233535 [Aquila chrysaetos chrysaetos]